jgi:exonuclease III
VKGCRRRTKTLRSVPIPTAKNERGADYGYTEADLGSSCYFSSKRLKLDYHATYEDGEQVPDGFSCLCYNIWGLAKSEKNKTLFSMRKPLLEKTIRDTNADIVCLQEMSAFSYDQLKDFIATYTFASEVPFTAGVKERNRSVEVYFLSKYKPSSVSIYGLKGVLDYENAFMVVEYPNLVIFNLYSQAGSKYSPGQEHKWIHYARCRYDILQTIYDLFLAKYKKKTCVMCGDFNFDLDGPVKEKSLSKQGCFIIGELERFHEGKTSYPSFSNCLRDILKFYNAETLLEVFRVDFGFTCGVPSDANKVFDSICQSFEQFLVNFI